jgi:hypothetical protein
MSADEQKRFIAGKRERGEDVSAFETDPRERLVQFLREFGRRTFGASGTLESLTLLEDTTDSNKRGGRYLARIPTSVFAPRYWRWVASAWPRENRHGRLRRPGLRTKRRRDLICMATPRRQNPRDSLGAPTPMNGEPRTDMIQLITRTGSLSGDDDSRARPADVDSSPVGDFGRVIRRWAGSIPVWSTNSKSLILND